MRFTHALCAAAAATVFPVAQVQAQSVDFGPEFASFVSLSISTTVSVPAGSTGAQTLSFAHAAGLNPLPSGGNLVVSVDGVNVGTVPAGQDCGTTLNDVLTIPDNVYTDAAVDGSITLAFVVPDPGALPDFCGGSFGPPFDGGTTVPLPALAVQGTLTTAGPAPTTNASQQQTTAALTRGAMVFANGPSYERRIYRLTGAGLVARGLSFEGTELLSNTPFKLDVRRDELNFKTAQGGAFWVEGSYTDISDDASSDQWFGVLHAGADTLITDGVLLGLGVQLDRLSSTDRATNDDFEGNGWLVGPYVTARLTPTLYLDGRLAFGRVDTDVDRDGGTSDSYDSDRALAEVALIGDQSYGAYTIEPRAELAWYREESDSYTSATLGPVGDTEVELGQAVLGGRVFRAGSFAGGQLTPYADLSAAYTYYETGSATSGSFGDSFEGWSGSIGLGIAFSGRGGSEWSVDATFTGAGDGDNATGLRAGVTIPF